MISKLNTEGTKWEAKEIRKKVIDNYNKTFVQEIG